MKITIILEDTPSCKVEMHTRAASNGSRDDDDSAAAVYAAHMIASVKELAELSAKRRGKGELGFVPIGPADKSRLN